MLLIERADGVVTLTLNRPDSLNALTIALKEQLIDALIELADDAECRALLLTGAGRAFCAGQDLREHADVLQRSGPEAALATVRRHYNPLALRLGTFPKPVVAAVNGMAAGAGASLALLADFRVGGPSTRFLMAFANVGLAADTGASWVLPRLVGHARATQMLMLAEPVSATEAERIGLLTELVADDGEILAAARRLAVRLAAGPAVAYAQIKRELVDAASLTAALEIEAEAQQICSTTVDHRAATEAFLAKERPRFTGR
mgnify:CR=1 FL=1